LHGLFIFFVGELNESLTGEQFSSFVFCDLLVGDFMGDFTGDERDIFPFIGDEVLV